jgi:hypothetical protein
MKRMLSAAFALVGTLCLGIAANAADAFTNYGSSGAYDAAPSDAWLIGGPGGGAESIAEQFTSAVSGALDSVTVSLGYGSGGTSWVASLRNDNGADNVGLTTFTSWTFTHTAPTSTGGGTITLPYTGPTISLLAGTKYWVAVVAGSDDLSGAWFWNSTGDGAPVYRGRQSFSLDGGVTWTNFFTGPRSVFKVSVVPEPATLATFATGLAGLVLSRRRGWAQCG